MDFYLPLIGPSALSVYLRLQEDMKPREGEVYSFERILNALKMTCGEFEQAMNALEAVALVNTYISEGEEDSYFSFVLFSPLTPNEFVEDPLLSGTLRKYIGEEGVAQIEARYKPVDARKDDMTDISTTFSEYFSPDLEQGYYTAEEMKVKGKRKSHVRTDFDRGEFERCFREHGENLSWLNEDDFVYIERIATLYGFSEEAVASLVMESFGYKDRKKVFDRYRFDRRCDDSKEMKYFRQPKGQKSQVSGETQRAKHIELMDSRSPVEYLSIKQNGHAVAPSDKALLRRLAFEYGLPDPVINALITYCLEKSNNALIPAYVEKVAASLQRAGITTARDAMEFLIGGNGSKKKTKITPTKNTLNETNVPSTNPSISDSSKSAEDDDEEKEYNRLMKKLKLVDEGD